MNREVILLLFPVMAGFCIPFGIKVSSKFGRVISLTSYLAGIIYGIIHLPGVMVKSRNVIIGNWIPPFGINLFFSPFTLGIVILIYGIASLVLLFDLYNTESRRGQYYLLYSLFVVSSVGMVLTGDIFNLFVFLEMGVIASSALIALGENTSGPERSLRYLIQAQGTSLLMLGGIALLYSAVGALNMAVFSRFEALKPSFALLTAVLILLPVLMQIKLYPLNTWAGGAFNSALTSFSASFCCIWATAGGVVLARFVLTIMNNESAFSSVTEKIRMLILVLGSLTILIGEAAALREKKLKRVLAFSSIGQMGMIAVGISAAGFASLKGALILLLSHAMAMALLFFTAGFLIRKSGTDQWRKMKGIGRKLYFPGGFFAVGAVALVGFPMFSGFWGKIELIRGVMAPGGIYIAGAAAILIGTIIEGVYFTRIVLSFFQHGGDWNKASYNPGFMLPSVILCAAVILTGVYPALIDFWLLSSIYELLNPKDFYADIIL